MHTKKAVFSKGHILSVFVVGTWYTLLILASVRVEDALQPSQSAQFLMLPPGK